jgi:hypothetical protein
MKKQGQWLSFRSGLGSTLVALDGVTYFSSEKISCPECLKRQYRNGIEHFYHGAITGSKVRLSPTGNRGRGVGLRYEKTQNYHNTTSTGNFSMYQ